MLFRSESGRRLIGNLSKGYQQRVGIAQAIVHEPSIVILDEPTSGLDPLQIREIRTLVRELGDAHCVILSTHILAEVQSICDRAIIITGGRIVLDASLDELAETQTTAHDIVVRTPPPEGLLENLAGVIEVTRNANGHLCVRHDGLAPTVDAIVSEMAPFGLESFVPHTHSLEDVFVHLTLREDLGAGVEEQRPLD